MKSFFGTVLSRLVSGFILLVPILIVALIVREILNIFAGLLQPIAVRLPVWITDGLGGGYGIAAVALLLFTLLVGLFAATPTGRRLRDSLERQVLGKVPGYTLIKSLAQGSVGQSSEDDVKVVLVTLDEAWLFGFLIEKHADGMLTVFVPAAPAPTSGSIYFFTEDQIRYTDLKIGEAMRCITRLGVGSNQLFKGGLRGVIERKAVPPADGTASLR